MKAIHIVIKNDGHVDYHESTATGWQAGTRDSVAAVAFSLVAWDDAARHALVLRLSAWMLDFGQALPTAGRDRA
jgi:hypothetical protein